jgi:mono/diheme cytochrome c family protein
MDPKRTSNLGIVILAAFLLASCELSLAQDIKPPPNYQRFSIEQPSAESVFVFPDSSPDLAAGADIFAESCEPCHGAVGMGGGSQVDKLPEEPPQIGTAELAEQSSPVDWFAMITLGNIESLMPPFEEDLSIQERWDVLAYVYSLSESGELLAGVLPEGMQIAELPQLEPSETAAPAETAVPTETVDATETTEITDEVNGEEEASESPDDTEETPSLNLGSVTGLVTHGAGGDIPPDLEIALLGFDGFEIAYNHTVTINSDGSFVFEEVETGPDRIFFVDLDYQGARYGSRFDVMPDDENTLDLPVTIYDTTSDTSNLVIATLVVQLEFPSADNVRLQHIYQVSNPSLETVVPPVDGEPVLSYTLPQNAINFSFEQQIGGDYFVITSDGFGDTRTILAGAEDYTLAYSYELPYSRDFTVDLHPGWAVDRLVVLLPPGDLQLMNDFMTKIEDTQIGSEVYQVHSGGSFPPGELQLEIEGRNPNAPPGFLGQNLDLQFIVSISVFIAALAAAVWFIRVRDQGRVQVVETSEDIMDAIIALDEEFEAGNIKEDHYYEGRQALKIRLRDILESSD